VNKDAEVMTEAFEQDFVQLRGGELAPQAAAELRFTALNVDSTLLRRW
jgi:hypothetical protein